MTTDVEIFQHGSELLQNAEVALDPRGTVLLDGYLLVVLDKSGTIYVTKRTPKHDNHKKTYLNTLAQFKRVNWSKTQKPTTPSVEMLLNMYFENLNVKAYAMWATSTKGVNASTFAVYDELNTEEITKFCGTMETCLDLYETNTTFTME